MAAVKLSNKLRISQNLREIARLLKKMQQNGFKVTIWQNIDGKREISTAYIHYINKNDRTLSLKPFGRKKFRFDKKMSIYIHGDEQSLLFKTSPSFNSKQMIVFPIPREVRLIEKRFEPRIDIEEKLSNEIIFDKFQGFKDKPNEFVFMCLDLSSSGLAFRIFSHDLTQFTIGNKLNIKKICNIKFDKNHQGEIVYIKAFPRKEKFGTSNIFRVGVKFGKTLDKQYLDKIEDVA